MRKLKKQSKMKFIHSCLLTLLITLTSCSSLKNPYKNITDEKAKNIIEQSIVAYGGLENWNNINYLGFDKWYALYDENGTEETNVQQKHHYTPEKIYMTWADGKNKIEQTKVGEAYTKRINNEDDKTAEIQRVKNSILAATFVMNFPYNLLDNGSTISYEGQSTFMDKPVHVIRVEYFPETQAHHTTKDIWWHYIDVNSYLGIGYKVKHLDHISLIKNTSFNTVKGFTLPGERESFRVDENGNELYLKARYVYSGFSVIEE